MKEDDQEQELQIDDDDSDSDWSIALMLYLCHSDKPLTMIAKFIVTIDKWTIVYYWCRLLFVK